MAAWHEVQVRAPPQSCRLHAGERAGGLPLPRPLPRPLPLPRPRPLPQLLPLLLPQLLPLLLPLLHCEAEPHGRP